MATERKISSSILIGVFSSLLTAAITTSTTWIGQVHDNVNLVTLLGEVRL